MVWLSILGAVLASAFNAGSSVLQRLAAGKPERTALFSRRQTIAVTFSRLFLIGLGLQILAFVMQALALSNGPLVIVEPLFTTDLIFLLIFINLTLGVRAGKREWAAVAAIIVGLSLMLVAAAPQGGHLKYALFPWIVTVSVLGGVVATAIVVTRRLKSAVARAFLAAIAAAISFALNAAFTKLALNLWQANGIVYALTHWPVYALAASGLLSLYLMQHAYGAGPLAISQPTMEITEPVVSVIIGMMIFGDIVEHDAPALALEALGVVLTAWGTILLASSNKLHVGQPSVAEPADSV